MTMPRENKSQAVDIARKAIPLMSERNIPITPQNYFVWYEYFDGARQDLKKTLDELINAETEFDDKLNYEIYNRFFGRSHSEEQERKLQEEIKVVEEVNATAGEILEPITKDLDSASQNTENYGAKLKEMVGKIEDNKNIGDMHPIIIALAKETEKISSENKAIGAGLKDSTQRLENLRIKLAQAKTEARMDDLTKLQNRRAFNERIVEIMEIVNKEEIPAILGIIDIDKFKRINDTYGHPVGDKALIALAGQLMEFTRKEDEIFRIGGEEFAVILPDCSLEKAFERMESICASIASHQFAIKDIVETITISVGLAQIEKGIRQEDVEKLADMALYLAKESGAKQCENGKRFESSRCYGSLEFLIMRLWITPQSNSIPALTY